MSGFEQQSYSAAKSVVDVRFRVPVKTVLHLSVNFHVTGQQ